MKFMNVKHKFNAKRVKTEDANFDSKIEYRYYQKLMFRKKSGDVLFFLRQVPFHLPGGVKMVIDFQEFHSDGTVHFVEVKGKETPLYITKKKMVEDLYPIQIEVIKKG